MTHTTSNVKFSREWAMPSGRTFSIPPIARLLQRYVGHLEVIVDPFSNGSTVGTVRNDLNPEFGCGGMDAETFCRSLEPECADAILFDPPYSPRQISELYKSIGLKVGTAETQNATLYSRVRRALAPLLKPGGVAISFGWNSAGFGKTAGFEVIEIMLVAHGGAHNDTIVVVERKPHSTQQLTFTQNTHLHPTSPPSARS